MIVIDIQKTAFENVDIISNLIYAHALLDCDTVACCNWKRKGD